MTVLKCRISMALIFTFGFFGAFFAGPLSAVNDSMDASPSALAVCALTSLSLIFFPRPQGNVKPGHYPGLLKRYLTASFDLVVAMFVGFSVMFPILLAIESYHRGEWVWSWEKAQSPIYGYVMTFTLLAVFAGIYLYHRVHLERGRATPGQYIMGYRIVPGENPNYNKRIWHGLLYLWLWFLAFAAKTKKDGIYVWDKSSDSQASCVS